jgi:hypothetical protein
MCFRVTKPDKIKVKCPITLQYLISVYNHPLSGQTMRLVSDHDLLFKVKIQEIGK